MKPGQFDYVRPADLGEAVRLVAEGRGAAKVLAGGQSLVPMLNLRLAAADLLVDVSRLPELQGADEAEGEVRIGAAVRHAAIEDGEVPDPARGLMQCAARELAYRAIRNQGTIGGSLALADPSAEWPAVLLALDAEVELRGPARSRRMPLADFLVAAYTTALADDEILEAITVPKLSPTSKWGYFKLCRKAGEYATSLAIVVLDRERGMERAVLGATNGRPLSLPRTASAAAASDGWSAQAESTLREAIEADMEAGGRGFDAFEHGIHAAAIQRAARQALTQ